MKKGLLTLVVLVALSLVGMVGNAAVPQLLGIPDVVIGDLEDQAFTDNFFVFSNAFAFDDYVEFLTSGIEDPKWFYTDAAPAGDQIAINTKLSTSAMTGATRLDTISASANFRNVAIAPFSSGGPYTITAGSTDAETVELTMDNVGLKLSQEFVVFTADGGNDELTGLYELTTAAQVVMDVDPNWILNPGVATAPGGPGLPYGLSPALGGYSATTDCLWLQTTGSNNNFGFWQQPNATNSPVDWVPGQAYVFQASVFANPIKSGALTTQSYIPWIRLRVNVANESLSQELDIQSYGSASLAVSTDAANPSLATMIFDPRDQSNAVLSDLDDLYFSYDMLDFQGASEVPNRAGLVGIKDLTVYTVPLKMFKSDLSNTIQAATYPQSATGKLGDTESDYLKSEFPFAGNPILGSVGTNGDLVLTSNNVFAAYAGWQLNANKGVTPNPAKWYWLKFYVQRGGGQTDWLRLRAFTADFQRSVNYNVRAYVSGYQLPATVGYTAYNVVIAGEAGMTSSQNICWAIDFIDFNSSTSENGSLSLSKVEVFALDPAL